MNIYLIIILSILIGQHILSAIVENLNMRHAGTAVPEEFRDTYDAIKYKRSQDYLKEKTLFDLSQETFLTIVTIAFILLGGFNLCDSFARSFNLGPILTGLIFIGTLLLALEIIDIPFSVYRTFRIETKYEFNRMNLRTFVSDIAKKWFLGAIIYAIVFAAVLWFFGTIGKFAWVYCWLGLTLFQLFLFFIAPITILPLFNKFTPLKDGQLKQAIEAYARSQNFRIKGIFTMDGSRRSTKSNAFFTGFGKFKRIALFDTLIAQHSTEELTSILAHEIGHYKKKHIFKGLLISFFTSGLMFLVLSLFINHLGLFAAFKMKQVSIYASLFFFAFLYAPISLFFSVLGSIISRRHEYEADSFAITTYKRPEAFISALKRLSVSNLSNLTPHPLKVFLHYSHPPVLQRIQAIRKMSN